MHKQPTVRETVGRAEVYYSFDSFEGLTLVVDIIINGHCYGANLHQKVKVELTWEGSGGGIMGMEAEGDGGSLAGSSASGHEALENLILIPTGSQQCSYLLVCSARTEIIYY